MADGFFEAGCGEGAGQDQARDDPFISSEQTVTGPEFSTK